MSAPLKRFVIVREMPGVGSKSATELAGAAQNSCNALRAVGSSNVQWVHSYVVADRTYCIYLAANEQAIKDHAAKAGIPADKIEEVQTILDPTSEAGA